MKPRLLLALILLHTLSCKKDHTTGNNPTTSETTPTQTQSHPQAPPPSTPPPPAPDPTPILLIYNITYPELAKRLEYATVENDPFAEVSLKSSSKLLARAGLPLPDGATITCTGPRHLLHAPPDYHQKLAVALGMKGTPPTPNSKHTDDDGLTDKHPEAPSRSK